MKKRVVVLASGSGSNFQALIDYAKTGDVSYEIVGLIVNIPNAFALERAKLAGIECKTIDHKLFATREDFEEVLHNALLNFKAEIVVCAGFMRILTASFTDKWEGRMINIHPSLLPKYKGLHTHQRAIEAGDKTAGCTVHYVNAGVDEGEIIGQAEVPIIYGDTSETLAERVLVEEHRLFPFCLEKVCGKLKV